ncbi:Pentatricopeptide repeat-containing protein [Capsicum chinense]|nr:Pentatricopeptide repeat-containing protein [Capsicum chinense]
MGETARMRYFWAKSVCYCPWFRLWAWDPGMLWPKNQSRSARKVGDHPNMVDKQAKRHKWGIFETNRRAIAHGFGRGPGFGRAIVQKLSEACHGDQHGHNSERPACRVTFDVLERGHDYTIHAYIIKSGFQSHKLVANSLIDMYAKCGQLDLSERVFEEMENTDSVSWNALLTAYSMHGEGDRALSVFSLMEKRGVEVDSISFLSVLSAGRHAGLVEEGRKIFHCMRDKYHIEPEVERYACLVDLLGRAGLFSEIMDLLKTMPMEPDGGVWGALLDASR